MKKFSGGYGKYNRLFWTLMGFLLLFLVGLLDYYTGIEISFSLFYVFPIALISWANNWKLGILASVLGAILWLAAESMAGAHYSYPAILYWNALVRLSIFVLMSLSTQLGKNLEHEAAKARTDFMTGALNSRSFHERLQLEIERIARYPPPPDHRLSGCG
jgi:glucose-6-phosphate-specific signal transduction histidine kinase